MALYPEKMMQYFRDLKHAGTIAAGASAAGASIYFLEQGSEEQGDAMQWSIQLENDVISKARFQCYGSPMTLAACEFLCGWLEGKKLQDTQFLKPDVILEALSLSPLYLPIAVRVIHMNQLLYKRVMKC